MEKGRLMLSCNIKMTLIFLASFYVWGCSQYDFVIINDPLSAEEHNDLGYAYENKGLFDLAEKEYKIAVRKKSEWYVPYFNLGNIEFKRGNYKEAERLYRTALKRDMNNPDIMNNIALCLSYQNRHDEAKAMIERALRIKLKEEYLDTLKRIELHSLTRE